MSDKEGSISKDHQKITVMAAIGIIGFLIVISIYGVATDPKPLEHPDPWYVYIVRFQTLIGGLLAVGAAFVTISQMRKSDDFANRRHQELLELQLKPMVQARASLLFTHAEAFEYITSNCETFRNELSRHLQSMENIAARVVLMQQLERCDGIIRVVDQVVSDENWDEFRLYLTPVIVANLFKLRTNSHLYLEDVPVLHEVRDMDSGALLDCCSELLDNYKTISESISAIYDELTE